MSTRIAAIIPVGPLEVAKSRLGGALDAEERQDLIERLLTRTVAVAVATEMLADALVVSPDRGVLQRAADLGARTLRQRTHGLNQGLDEARADAVAGGAAAIVVLPIDLPFIAIDTLTPVLEHLDADPGPAVVLVPDRHGTGTNILALRPADIVAFAFGPGSREAHRDAAAAAGATYVEVDGPLVFDLDTPEDLVLVDSMTPEEIGAG